MLIAVILSLIHMIPFACLIRFLMVAYHTINSLRGSRGPFNTFISKVDGCAWMMDAESNVVQQEQQIRSLSTI
uniref:Putative secreted protein n=1 Tax=Anopheles darlingi TaxID=43151 RepID=A0A2M4DFX9_ANODA